MPQAPPEDRLPSSVLQALRAAGDQGGLTGYLAPEGRVPELLRELDERPLAVLDRLVLTAGPRQDPAWCANRWLDPRVASITSIKDAARTLRGMQRNWVPYATRLHRRTALIEAQLPHVSAHPIRFPDPPPTAPLGSFTLLAPDVLLAAPTCDSPVPHGAYRFVEDREGPPSRAYLKLYEALTRYGAHPGSGDRCLDLGASPGGFTWVCQRLGASVLAVDKAPLDPRIAALPRVRSVAQSAFALAPSDVEPVDWLISDVVCYPKRLLALIERWIASGRARRILATVKLQGAGNTAVVPDLNRIPDGRVVHLHHNKHELTFFWPTSRTPR